MRPLAFDYPADANVANRTDAWMFGDWLVAAPVVDKQQKSKAIYLPAGTWTDYFRGVTYSGGQTIQYPLNSESWTDIPVFIKQGAIIPSQQVQDYVGQRIVDTVNVDVFPSSTATSFAYYEDDGTTYDYEGGATFEQTLTAQDNGGSGYSFSVGEKSGTYLPDVDYIW